MVECLVRDLRALATEFVDFMRAHSPEVKVLRLVPEHSDVVVATKMTHATLKGINSAVALLVGNRINTVCPCVRSWIEGP